MTLSLAQSHILVGDTVYGHLFMSDTVYHILTQNHLFLKFKIIDFYPLIMKDLLLHSINLAKNYTEITQEELDITLTYRKCILNKDTTWVKMGTDNFDVTMGSFRPNCKPSQYIHFKHT